MIRYYILDKDGEPIPEPDLLTWASWFEKGPMVIGRDVINGKTVSTVFLGLDHSFEMGAEPVLWETMVFSDSESAEMDRCGGSREQAEAMHARMVQKIAQEKTKAAK